MNYDEYQKELEDISNQFNDGDLTFIEFEQRKKDLSYCVKEE